MTEQVVAATRGRTVIAARCGDHALTPPAQGPGGAGTARAGASRQSTGRCGEDLAATYLEDIGWQVLERNWRPGHGLSWNATGATAGAESSTSSPWSRLRHTTSRATHASPT